MEADERDVRRGVRIVDRVGLPVLDDRLAGVELPAEERVHEAADDGDLPLELGRKDVELDLVAVVAVRAGVVAHDARLRPDGEAAGEDIEVLDARLQVHHPLARLVVGCV